VDSRTKSLLGLSLLFVLLGVARIAPASAGSLFGTTEGYLDSSSVFHPASEVPPGDKAADVADISTLDTGCTTDCGSVTFDVYDGGTCAGSPVATDTEPASAGNNVQSAGLVLSPGSHSWRDTYATEAGTILSICEDFEVQSTSIPQFPLGLPLLVALVIPALFVLRKRVLTLRSLAH